MNENAISAAVLVYQHLKEGKCGKGKRILSEDERKGYNLDLSTYIVQQGSIPLNHIGAGDTTILLLALKNFTLESTAGKSSSKNNVMTFVTDLASNSTVDVDLAPSQVVSMPRHCFHDLL